MSKRVINIGEAAESYLQGRTLDTSEQAEVRRFERWLGRDRSLSGLKPVDIEQYSGRFSASDPDGSRKIEAVKKFLSFLKDQGWSQTNLGLHLRIKRGRLKASGVTRAVRPEFAVLTRQGYDDVTKELAELRAERPQVLEEIRRAAADKDFRENAPLHAAREQLGHIDGRIQELAAMLKSASIIGEAGASGDRVGVGDTVQLIEVVSGRTWEYTIVGPKEANPAQGRVSHVSPIGKAVLGKAQGDEAEVDTPGGGRVYRICGIKKC